MADLKELGTEESANIEAQINPFLLHPSYNSITTLVNQPLVGASNYISWKRAMTIALSGKNKEGFISGDVKKPSNPKLVVSRKMNNDIICSWIINSVSKEIAASIVYNGDVKEIWDELSERFKERNGPIIFQLRKELVTTTQGASSVETYFTKIKTIWQDLLDFRPSNDCTCGGFKSTIDHLNLEYVMIFLMGLNDSYAGIRSQILLMDPIHSISKVFSLVIQEERQRTASVSTQMMDPIVLLAADTKNGEIYNVGYSSRRSSTKCTHCGYKGHTNEKCYKLHGYPLGYRPRNSSTSSVSNDGGKSSRNSNTAGLNVVT